MRKKRPSYFKVVQDGSVIAVVRPEDPEVALRLARDHKTEEEFQEILRAQKYFFVGILANEVVGNRSKTVTKPVILCAITNKKIDEPRPGDSFVYYPQLLESTPDLLDRLKKALH